MLRLAWAGIALACSAAFALAAPPPPVEDPGNAPMRFEWRREGPASVCGSSCRVWISAVGYLTSDTAREFEAFAEKRDVRGAVLVLDSDGGSVLGTIALGRVIRRLEMVTTVGKTTPLPPTADGDRRAKLTPNASCESMCAFLLLAGTRRYVPPQAHVLVHQIWLGKKRKNALDFELFGRGAQPGPARHRALGAIHGRDGRRHRSARDRLADSALGAALRALQGRDRADAAQHHRDAVRS